MCWMLYSGVEKAEDYLYTLSYAVLMAMKHGHGDGVWHS
jgi:hypothetical protein